jgi:hypothetical protein
MKIQDQKTILMKQTLSISIASIVSAFFCINSALAAQEQSGSSTQAASDVLGQET